MDYTHTSTYSTYMYTHRAYYVYGYYALYNNMECMVARDEAIGSILLSPQMCTGCLRGTEEQDLSMISKLMCLEILQQWFPHCPLQMSMLAIAYLDRIRGIVASDSMLGIPFPSAARVAGPQHQAYVQGTRHHQAPSIHTGYQAWGIGQQVPGSIGQHCAPCIPNRHRARLLGCGHHWTPVTCRHYQASPSAG